MGHGRRINLIYHWLIHLSEPGRVISLSIHPTCSEHKFPFSVQGQLAGLESRRRFRPISVKPIKVELATLTLPSGKGGRGVWGLAEEWEGLTRCHKLLDFLMHPLRTANQQPIAACVCDSEPRNTAARQTILIWPFFAQEGSWCQCHSQSAGKTTTYTHFGFDATFISSVCLMFFTNNI